jgi:hypothetical protein
MVLADGLTRLKGRRRTIARIAVLAILIVPLVLAAFSQFH